MCAKKEEFLTGRILFIKENKIILYYEGILHNNFL